MAATRHPRIGTGYNRLPEYVRRYAGLLGLPLLFGHFGKRYRQRRATQGLDERGVLGVEGADGIHDRGIRILRVGGKLLNRFGRKLLGLRPASTAFCPRSPDPASPALDKICVRVPGGTDDKS